MEMVVRFDDIVDQCIDRLLPVERPEECLQHDPEEAVGLERLLQVALALSLCATFVSPTLRAVTSSSAIAPRGSAKEDNVQVQRVAIRLRNIPD